MSLEMRQRVVDALFFQDEVSKSDLLGVNITDTRLIAVLAALISRDQYIEITAVRNDHSDDSYLGPHAHAYGMAVDCWPLASATAGDYLDSGDVRFAHFLTLLHQDPTVFQVGLGGSAYTSDNMALLGSKGFEDNGSDHVHVAV